MDTVGSTCVCFSPTQVSWVRLTRKQPQQDEEEDRCSALIDEKFQTLGRRQVFRLSLTQVSWVRLKLANNHNKMRKKTGILPSLMGNSRPLCAGWGRRSSSISVTYLAYWVMPMTMYRVHVRGKITLASMLPTHTPPQKTNSPNYKSRHPVFASKCPSVEHHNPLTTRTHCFSLVITSQDAK